eukprot:23306-Prymnesium_polylepis.1
MGMLKSSKKFTDTGSLIRQAFWRRCTQNSASRPVTNHTGRVQIRWIICALPMIASFATQVPHRPLQPGSLQPGPTTNSAVWAGGTRREWE